MADHDQLVCGFQKMEPATSHFLKETVPPDLGFDPMAISPDHTARGHGLGGKDLVNPDLGITLSDPVHGATIAAPWLI